MSEVSPKKRRKIWYKQAFKVEWLQEPEFKDWLKRDSTNENNSYCICCGISIKNANKSMLLAHKNTDKHKRNFESAKSTVAITSFLKKKAEPESAKIAKAEALFAGFFSEHHVPFAHVNHLVDVCKRAFPDSKIAQEINMKRSKLSYIIQDGIAYYEKLELNEICQKQKFSLIIDESTDISVTQVLAIVIRFFDKVKLDVADALLDSVVVESGTGEGLFNAVKALFNERNIPLSNVIGFGSDNCTTMMGKKSGFQKLLKDSVPSVFILGCVCHSFALCASYAVSVLPSFLESLLKDLTSYFSRSSKRQNDFAIIQDVVETTHHRIPKLAQTRWLSREKVINIILEQWDALVLYFQSEMKTDKVDGTQRIYEQLTNRGTKHMLCFLQYVLQKINTLNLEFQSEHFRLHNLYSAVSLEYKTILSLFVKEDLLMQNKLSELDPSNKMLHKDIENLYLGGRTMALLHKEPLSSDCICRFKKDCLKFLIELCLQIKKRFSFDDDGIIAKLKILDPKVANDPNSPMSIANLAVHFTNLISEDQLNDLDDEWRSFRLSTELHTFPENMKIPEYWNNLSTIKNALGQPKYELLSRFMTDLTVLPHSSASVERIFSQMNYVKTKTTNKLKPETTRDRILARQRITKHNKTCVTWEPKQELIHDLQEGTTYRRYSERLKSAKTSNEMATLYEDSDDEI